MPRSTRALGAEAERAALLHYRLRGYRVLAVNAWAGGNELDLVVRRGRRLVFVEVKARGSDRLGDPLEAIGAEKIRRVRRAAASFLASNPELLDLQIVFEAAALRGRRLVRVPF